MTERIVNGDKIEQRAIDAAREVAADLRAFVIAGGTHITREPYLLDRLDTALSEDPTP